MKIISLFVVSMFMFVSLGFCSDTSSPEDCSHHCIMCCSSGHCNYAVTDTVIPKPLFTASKAVITHDIAHQDLFVSDIDRPPNTIL